MKVKASEFLLISIAFLSVFSSAEVSVPSNVNTETFFDANSNQRTKISSAIQTKEDEQNIGTTTATNVHELEKREANIFNGQDKNKDSGLLFEDSNFLYSKNEPNQNSQESFEEMKEKSGYQPHIMEYYDKTTQRNPDLRFLRSLSGFLGKKRAPVAFHGMRGKKSDDYEADVIEPPSLDLKDLLPNQEFLRNSGLIDNRRTVLDYEEPENQKNLEEKTFEDDGFSKRSPYSFQGMRGKKGIPYDFKRAMGFLGMRGKKATEIWESDGNYKRVPQTGFFGIKGKKAQSGGFFGMRGKKASSSAFFGIKGKREPLDYDFQDVSLLSQMKVEEPSKNRIRRAIAWINNSKKGKSTFFGIRGKKATTERLEARSSAIYE